MKVNLEINNKTKSRIKKADLEGIAKRSIEKSGLGFLTKKEIEISLRFLPDQSTLSFWPY